MKALVVYSTLTGNTRKVAEAIHAVLPEGTACRIAGEAPDPADYDFVAMGFWVDKGGPDAEAAAYMKRIAGKKVFTFFTLGADPGSEHARTCAERAAAAYGEGCVHTGVYWCQGAIDPKLIEWMRKQPAGGPHSPTPEAEARWAKAALHPDEADLKAAAAAARKAFAEASR